MVLASWQCWAHLTRHVPPGKRILRICLDETSVAYWDTKKSKGNVAISRRASRGRATTRQLRTHLTHIAIVCDDPEVQLLLPQILLIAGAVLPLNVVDEIREFLPDNVEVWRAASGWVNHRIFCKVVERLIEALEPFRATHQCILSMDVYSVHYHCSVLRAARLGGIWVCFVPARLTWLLQVLDTHIFARYKEYLRDLFSKARSQDPAGCVSIVTWIRIICETITGVLQAESWSPCFDRNGYACNLVSVRPAIWRHTGLAHGALVLPVSRPTWAQLRCIFPRLPPHYFDLFPPLSGAGRRLLCKTRSAH